MDVYDYNRTQQQMPFTSMSLAQRCLPLLTGQPVRSQIGCDYPKSETIRIASGFFGKISESDWFDLHVSICEGNGILPTDPMI